MIFRPLSKPLLVAVVTLYCLMTPASALAGTILSVELEGARDAMPGWVCLVRTPKSGKATTADVGLQTTDVKLLIDAWVNSRGMEDAEFKKALDSNGDSSACALKGVCNAEFGKISSSASLQMWAMRCTRNIDVESQRVAVVRLDHSGVASVNVVDFTVHGRSLRISIADTIDTVLNMTVIGGHYATGTSGSAHPKFNALHLLLEPRCVARAIPAVPANLELPRSAQYFASNGANGAAFSCNNPEVVLVPSGADGTTKTLTVFVKQKADVAQPVIGEFTAHWTSVYPPENLEFRAIAIDFSVELPCEYPTATCPDASFPGTGMMCQNGTYVPGNPEKKVVRSCYYHCSRRVGTGQLSLPAPVTLRGGEQSSAWQGALSHAGELVGSAYVPANQRRFILKTDNVPDEEDTGDETGRVELTTPDGQRVITQLRNQKGQRLGRIVVTLPNTTCGQSVVVHYLGPRDYDPDPVEVQTGEIPLPVPEDSSQKWYLGGRVGGGVFLVPNDEITDRPYGEASAAIRFRPGPKDNYWLVPSSYELEATYLASAQPYLPLRDPQDRSEARASSVPYNRFIFDLGATWGLLTAVEIGLSLGLGFGYPLHEADEQRVGRTTLVKSGRACVGWSPSLHIAVNGCFRYLLDENYLRFPVDQDQELFASPQPETDSPDFLGLGLGLRAWL